MSKVVAGPQAREGRHELQGDGLAPLRAERNGDDTGKPPGC
jgi:hypothetical protein